MKDLLKINQFEMNSVPCQWNFVSETFKSQPHKMVKHTQITRRLLPTNCLSVFENFVRLALKGLNIETCIISWHILLWPGKVTMSSYHYKKKNDIYRRHSGVSLVVYENSKQINLWFLLLLSGISLPIELISGLLW